MSLTSLHKYLKSLPEVHSANALARQHSLSASSVCNVLKNLGYTYTGEGWKTPPKPIINSPLSISEESFAKLELMIEEAKKEDKDLETGLKEALPKLLEEGKYRAATQICLTLYILSSNPLPLVL